jgi:hypothetical protein
LLINRRRRATGHPAEYGAVGNAEPMNRPPLDRCTDGLPLPPVDDLDSVGPFVIRCVYALPRDGTDRRLGEDGTISRSLSAMQAWFAAQTGVRLRFADELGTPTRTLAAVRALRLGLYVPFPLAVN